MNAKLFLPFDNFKLLTRLSATEVQHRMESITEPRKAFRGFFVIQKTKLYQGHVAGNQFEISRIITYRNSFLPLIRGHVSTYMGQTEVAIRMRPVLFVLIFMGFWLGIVGVICLVLTIEAFRQRDELLAQGVPPVALVPFGMFVFGYMLLLLAYKTESRKSKAFLTQLLEAEEQLGS